MTNAVRTRTVTLWLVAATASCARAEIDDAPATRSDSKDEARACLVEACPASTVSGVDRSGGALDASATGEVSATVGSDAAGTDDAPSSEASASDASAAGDASADAPI